MKQFMTILFLLLVAFCGAGQTKGDSAAQKPPQKKCHHAPTATSHLPKKEKAVPGTAMGKESSSHQENAEITRMLLKGIVNGYVSMGQTLGRGQAVSVADLVLSQFRQPIDNDFLDKLLKEALPDTAHPAPSTAHHPGRRQPPMGN